MSAPRWPALAILALGLGGGIGASLCACPTSGTLPPAPPAPSEVVYSELTEAGCLEGGAGVMNAIVAEYQTGHDPWLGCMFEGGSIQACNAPCERAGWVRRPTDGGSP